jgi:hypothetical protein
MSTIKLDITTVFEKIAKYIDHDYIPYLMGPSGIGKTQMSEQLAKKKGWAFREYNCTYADFADWGLYIKKNKQHYYMKDTLDEKLVEREVVEAVIPEHMDWLFNATEPTLVLVDELPLAPEIIQGNLMAAFNERHVRGRKISDNVYFIVAGNRPKDRVGGNPIKWPLLSRMDIFSCEVTPKYVGNWSDHMVREGVNPLYAAIIRNNPEWLSNAVPNTVGDKGGDPRAWHKALARMTDKGEDQDILASTVGETNAIQFMAVLELRKDFPDIEEAIADPSKFTPSPDRLDLNYAFGSALAYYATEENFPRILDVVEKLPKELQVRVVKDCGLRNKDLTNLPLYFQFILDNN